MKTLSKERIFVGCLPTPSDADQHKLQIKWQTEAEEIFTVLFSFFEAKAEVMVLVKQT